MTNLTPADQWDGIYQLEENDPVQGGVGGVSNLPLQNLTNRTERIHQSLLDVGIDIVNKVYSNPTTTKIGPVRKATNIEIENGLSVANAFIDPEQFYNYIMSFINILSNNLIIASGIGSPENVVIANPGSIYLNVSGGENTTLYIKESGIGNTGWIAK